MKVIIHFCSYILLLTSLLLTSCIAPLPNEICMDQVDQEALGICQGSERLICESSQANGWDFSAVPGYEPSEQSCDDGLDNDCDGFIDEGSRNSCGTCGTPPREICDDIDNDCDGVIDEGVRNACGTCGIAPRETCDGVDNDCDLRIDEEFVYEVNSAGLNICNERVIALPCSPNCPAMPLTLIPASRFMIGSNVRGGDEAPSFELTPAFSYLVGTTEVTTEQYDQCLLSDVCTLPEHWTEQNYILSTSISRPYPVQGVTWEQAQTFNRWLGGELPPESLWELAAITYATELSYLSLLNQPLFSPESLIETNLTELLISLVDLISERPDDQLFHDTIWTGALENSHYNAQSPSVRSGDAEIWTRAVDDEAGGIIDGRSSFKGLRDFYGNLWEWVRDDYSDYSTNIQMADYQSGSPYCMNAECGGDESVHVARGGGYSDAEGALYPTNRNTVYLERRVGVRYFYQLSPESYLDE